MQEQGLEELLNSFSEAHRAEDLVWVGETILSAKLVNKARHDERFSKGLMNCLTVGSDSESGMLKALAMAYRLGATSKPVMTLVRRLAPPVLKSQLPPLELLADGQERYYASLSLLDANGEWVLDYAARGVAREETAETARVVLAKRLMQSVSVAEGLARVSTELERLTFETDRPAESASKRMIRVIAALRPAIVADPISPGEEVGKSLSTFFKSGFARSGPPTYGPVTNGLARECCALVYDVLRTQLTVVADPAVYRSLSTVRGWIGAPLWPRFVKNNQAPESVLGALEGAIVLLAKQRVTDPALLDTLLLFVASREEALVRTSTLARANPGLEPQIREWLGNFGRTRSTPVLSTMLDARESGSDPAIASLLIAAYLVSCDGFDAKCKRDVLIERMIEEIKSLASSRNLFMRLAKGDVVDYYPAAHEMVGGHMMGISRVCVIKPLVERIGANGISTVIQKALVEPQRRANE